MGTGNTNFGGIRSGAFVPQGSPAYDPVALNIVTPNVATDQAAALNAWMLTLPLDSDVFFPAVAGSSDDNTHYYCSGAVELPPDIGIIMPYGARVMFSALPGFTGYQLVRNWQAADGLPVATLAPATTATPVYYVRLINAGFDLNGQSNLAAVCICAGHPPVR